MTVHGGDGVAGKAQETGGRPVPDGGSKGNARTLQQVGFAHQGPTPPCPQRAHGPQRPSPPAAANSPWPVRPRPPTRPARQRLCNSALQTPNLPSITPSMYLPCTKIQTLH